MHDLKMTDQVA